MNHNQHAFNIKYLANLIKKYWKGFCYQKLKNSLVSFPAPPAWRSRGSHLGKFAWASNLALVLEAMQSRPVTTFPENCHDYSEHLEVLPNGFVSPVFQSGDIDKITTSTNDRCEAGRHFTVEYRHHLGPRMDDTVGKTYQAYNSFVSMPRNWSIYHHMS